MGQPKKTKSWSLTLNNYDAYPDQYHKALLPCMTYFAYSHEVGAKGTPHLQGYCQTRHQMSLSALKKKIGDKWHLEMARGNTEQNLKYIQKEAGVVSWGECTNMAGLVVDEDGNKKTNWLRHFILFLTIPEEDGDPGYRHIMPSDRARVVLCSPMERALAYESFIQRMSNSYFWYEDVVLTPTQVRQLIWYKSSVLEALGWV